MRIHARLSLSRLKQASEYHNSKGKCVTVTIISKQSFRDFGSSYRESVPLAQKQYDWATDLSHCLVWKKYTLGMILRCVNLPNEKAHTMSLSSDIQQCAT